MKDLTWEQILEKARGAEVGFAMWAGDQDRNRVIRTEIGDALKSRYGITLRIVPLGDTVEGVNKLLNEKSAGKTAGGSFDVIWINGENFRAAKQGKALWGPFSAKLPNMRLYAEAASERDFGTPIEGMEVPWQKAQFVIAYDTARVQSPPLTFDAMKAWVQANPGRFTYIAPPDFAGSAFLRHVLLWAGKQDPRFWKGFDEGLYRMASTAAFAYLNAIKPYLWRKGETYPPSGAELARLFANKEVDYAMSYSPSFASLAISRGQLPATVRTFVWDSGTLGNYSYLAIAFNSDNPAAAMVTINELMSFESALSMARAMDSGSPHRLEQLTEAQRAQVLAQPRGPATLRPDELRAHFLTEPDAEYLNRFDKEWREKVLRQ